MRTKTKYILCVFLCITSIAKAQTEKQINHQNFFWLGSVNTIRFNEHWGVIADFHLRTYNFMSSTYYYIARGQANYWFNENLTAGAGFAHIWSGPTKAGPKVFSNEHRITESVQLNSKKGKFTITNRWRLEQRWQQKIVNNAKTHDYRFTNRARYQLTCNYAPFKNKYLPSFSAFNEMMLQFGKEVVYNTFDQERLYIGIRQTITPQLNVDLGYMYIYQQQFSGNQYLSANTLRLYINYNIGWRKDNNQKNKTAFVAGEQE